VNSIAGNQAEAAAICMYCTSLKENMAAAAATYST
jgi:hypothetical protein